MGTVLKEKGKKIKKKVSLYSLLILPAIAVGLTLLLYQSFMLYTGKSYRDFDFEIGKLWSSEVSNVDEPIEATDVIIRVISESERIPEIRPPDLRPYRPQDPGTVPARQVNLSHPEFIADQGSGIKFSISSATEVQRIELQTQFSNPLVARYIRQIDNDYLVDPNLVGERGRWFVGISFAPSINYRIYNYNSHVAGVVSTPDTRYVYGMTESYRDKTDKAVSSYYTGIDIGLTLGKRFELATGLYYSIYGESISVSKVDPNDLNAHSSSYYQQQPLYVSPENKDQPTTFEYSNRFSYVEIPITLSYLVLDNPKVDISVQAGLYGIMMDHANALIYDFETDFYYWMNRTDYEIYRKYGFGGTGGVVLSQFIGHKLEVFVNPQFKYNFTSTFKDPYPVQQKQYATGFRLGFRQHFSR